MSNVCCQLQYITSARTRFQNLKRSRDSGHAPFGVLCHNILVPAMLNRYIKFEVSSLTRCKDQKGDPKFTDWSRLLGRYTPWLCVRPSVRLSQAGVYQNGSTYHPVNNVTL